MYKKILNIILIFCCAFVFCACDKNKSIILFNQNPITNENFLNNSTKFYKNKRFYYIFITQKPLKVNSIRVRVMKREDKASMSISKVVYSNDFRLAKDNIYYYSDYLVFNEPGYYCMFIYAADRLNRPMAMADFQIADY